MKKTYREKLNNSIKKIKDSKMRDIYKEFVMFELGRVSNKVIYNYQRDFYLFSKSLRNIYFDDFTWECMCQIVQNDKENVKTLSYFVAYLIEKDLYIGEYKKYIACLSEFLSKLKITTSTLVKLFEISKNPIHFYILKCRDNIKGLDKLSDMLIDLNTSNIFLRKILIEFINSAPSTSRSYIKFFSCFESSLGKTKVSKIKDFNIYTFDFQFEYYSTIESGKFLNILSSFYLFLCVHYISEKIFSDKDKVDLDVLKRIDFVQSYKLGFRKILYNPNDPVPIYNKWFLAPNGFERETTRINANDYMKIDFDNIEDEAMKQYAKIWFWKSNTASVKSKILVVNNFIRVFANFIYNFRKNTNTKIISSSKVIDEDTISQFEMYAFKNYIQSNYKNNITIATILSNSKCFIDFLDDNNLVKVEPGVAYLLKHKKNVVQYIDKNIPIEDLKAFEKLLKEKANESYRYTLYYALFHLAISCELRISQLVNLRIDSIQEGMKKGEYVIKSITKSSKGEKIEQPISARTKNHIDNILRITENIRNECPNTYLSKFLFLSKSKSNVYGVVKAIGFLNYLKRCCKLAGIPRYTPKNLRATYITKAKEISDENNWSKFDFLKITNHKGFDVVDKHYIGNQIRNLLEATYGIIIGNTPVKGQVITDSIVEQTVKNTVDDGCAMCTIKICTIQTELGCPMCPNYIVTLKNIPYFEKKIIRIDEKILNTNIIHEVELLRAIKKIYVAYLERLYILREGINNE